MTVENFVRIVWTVFEKIEKKMKNGRSGKGREKKTTRFAYVVEKFFRLLKSLKSPQIHIARS